MNNSFQEIKSHVATCLPIDIAVCSWHYRLEDMADIFINSILYLLRYFFQFPFFIRRNILILCRLIDFVYSYT